MQAEACRNTTAQAPYLDAGRTRSKHCSRNHPNQLRSAVRVRRRPGARAMRLHRCSVPIGKSYVIHLIRVGRVFPNFSSEIASSLILRIQRQEGHRFTPCEYRIVLAWASEDKAKLYHLRRIQPECLQGRSLPFKKRRPPLEGIAVLSRIGQIGMGANLVFIHETGKTMHMMPAGFVKEIQEKIPRLFNTIWSQWDDTSFFPDWYPE